MVVVASSFLPVEWQTQPRDYKKKTNPLPTVLRDRLQNLKLLQNEFSQNIFRVVFVTILAAMVVSLTLWDAPVLCIPPNVPSSDGFAHKGDIGTRDSPTGTPKLAFPKTAAEIARRPGEARGGTALGSGFWPLRSRPCPIPLRSLS